MLHGFGRNRVVRKNRVEQIQARASFSSKNSAMKTESVRARDGAQERREPRERAGRSPIGMKARLASSDARTPHKARAGSGSPATRQSPRSRCDHALGGRESSHRGRAAATREMTRELDPRAPSAAGRLALGRFRGRAETPGTTDTGRGCAVFADTPAPVPSTAAQIRHDAGVEGAGGQCRM